MAQSTSRPYSSHLSTLDLPEENLQLPDSRDESRTLRVVPEMTVNLRLAADALGWVLLYFEKTNNVELYKEALATALRLNITVNWPEELLNEPADPFLRLRDLAVAINRPVHGDIGIIDCDLTIHSKTILHKACAAGVAEILEPLFWRGACFDAIDCIHGTPLACAIYSGDIDTVRYALALGSDPNLNCPLFDAFTFGRYDIVTLLLNHGADINQRLDERTILSAAIEESDLEKVRLALSLGADPNVAHPMDNLIDDCLWEDCRREDCLWEHGPWKHRYNCVHEELACLLVEHGADVSRQSRSGDTIFHYAAIKAHAQLLRMALHRINSPMILDIGNNFNKTPLHYVIGESGEAPLDRSLDLTSMLLEAGADVNVQNAWGGTALMLAAISGRDDLVRLLLDAGAIVKGQCHRGHTALSYAAGRGHSTVVGLLLERVAPNHEDNSYFTLALEEAFEGDHRDVVKQLISFGADSSAEGVLSLALKSPTS
ncbi:hypothetical protein MBLNU13_g06173t1 [Cladosporium sp. NU13]